MIKIYFLGTGAGSPTLMRWAPSIAISNEGEIGLLDCGEGCQLRLQDAGISIQRIRFIALTHTHGDHISGLLPLLQSMTLHDRKNTLDIIAPLMIKDLVDSFLRISGHKPSFNIEFRDPLSTNTYNRVSVKGFRSCHTIESYGYLVEARSRRGFVRICYTGDTEFCREVIERCRGVDIMIHDSTFSSEHSQEALISRHSTAEDAARAAAESGAERLYLFHISSRYSDLEEILREARKIFKNTYIANDLDTIVIL
ncbi:MAG: ribonuclease Z [Sulfolobales archaeon]